MALRIPKHMIYIKISLRPRMPGELAGGTGAGVAGAGWLGRWTAFAAFRSATTDINDQVLIRHFFSCSCLQR